MLKSKQLLSNKGFSIAKQQDCPIRVIRCNKNLPPGRSSQASMCKESPRGSGCVQGFQLMWMWGVSPGNRRFNRPHPLVGFVYVQTLLAEQSPSPLRPSVMAQKSNHISLGEICTDLNFLLFIL